MNGTGVGQPLGYLKSNALITVAIEGGQAADTLDVLNISKMYSRMPSASVASAVWILNSSVLPQLLNLVIGTQPVYQAPMGFASAPFGTLLGRPIIWNDDAPTLGDANDIQFVDPRGYAAYRKQSGMKFDTSMHLFFDYGVQAFRWTTRFGGRPFLSAPITPANGPTKSTFIGLAERS
jgi:HK97 family phage major capsid protein